MTTRTPHPWFQDPADYDQFIDSVQSTVHSRLTYELSQGVAHATLDRQVQGAGSAVAAWEAEHRHDLAACESLALEAVLDARETFYDKSADFHPEGAASLETLYQHHARWKIPARCKQQARLPEPIDPAHLGAPTTWMEYDPEEVVVLRVDFSNQMQRLMQALARTEPPWWKYQAIAMFASEEYSSAAEVARELGVPERQVQRFRVWLRKTWDSLDGDG